MTLEPRVILSIKKYRRKVVIEKIALLFPYIATNILFIAFILIEMLTYKACYYYLLPVLIFFVILFRLSPTLRELFGLISPLYLSIKNEEKRFSLALSRTISSYDRNEYLKFKNALEGVCIASGSKCPRLFLLDDPVPNALACKLDNKVPSIAITKGLLELDVPVNEANAIMAHELAHIIIGEDLNPPSLISPEFFSGFLFSTSLIFGFVALPLAIAAVSVKDISYILFIIAAIILVALIALQYSQRFVIKFLELIYKHSDYLADSIAIKITGDPTALENAIRRIEHAVRKNESLPGGLALAKYLFVTPPGSISDYFLESTFEVEKPLMPRRKTFLWYLLRRIVSNAWFQILHIEVWMIEERLRNIELIKQGYWKAFEWK